MSEEFLDDKNLVCLNTGKSTIIDIKSGKESILNLKFVSSFLDPLCEWKVRNKPFRSDHYIVVSKVRTDQILIPEISGGKWMFWKKNWGIYNSLCERKLLRVQDHLSVAGMN